MKEIYIYTELLTKITNIVNLSFPEFNEKDKLRLTSNLIAIWYQIYEAQQNDEEALTLNYYTNIYSTDFKKYEIIISRNRLTYAKQIELLKIHGVVIINDKYEPKKFSKSYRVDTSFMTNSYTSVLVNFKKLYKDQIIKEEWIKKFPNHRSQIEQVYLTKIDLPRYVEWIEKNIGISLPKKTTKEGKTKHRTLTVEVSLRYINDALKINQGVIWFAIPDNTGRFYTSLTSLTNTAKPFFRLKGRPVVEIDINNCQPLLLSTIVDHPKYKRDCENGVFYDKLAKELNMERKDVKVPAFKYIFFNDKELKSGMLYESMEKIYPGLISQINNIKTNSKLAIQLQKIEADIFVNHLALIGMDNILRHDSIFVYEENVEDMKRVIKTAFWKIGLNVELN